MYNLCKVLGNVNEGITGFDSQIVPHGRLLPKDKNLGYQIVIMEDNPDISSLVLEKKLSEQAFSESEKLLGYNLKIWHEFEYPYPLNTIDIRIEFRDNDPYFTDNVLAWGGYPNGSLAGRAVFNNKFAWLDGHARFGSELRKLGIILPNMFDTQLYTTFNYRQTLKHEVCGHVLGLGHTDDESDVMHAIYDDDRLMFGKQSKGTLHDLYGYAGLLKRLKPDSYIKSVMGRKENMSRYI